jgi:threonine dehydrogenase-like Zn-dependent dehydrogenase
MGHEMAGEVVDPGTAPFRSGDRVIIDPELYCGACFHCRIGKTHLCPNGMLLGRDANGGFAEYLAAPATHVFELPDSIDRRAAPMIQVLTTCLHAQRQIDIFPGEYVVVLGLGVTGQLHVQLAKARGATVIGVTRSADKRALAETLGADVTLPGDASAVARVREATEGRGPDVVIETTGVVQQLAAAVDMTRSGGRILMFGIITAKEGALPFYDLYYKELSLINARVAKSEDYPGAIGLVQREQVRLEPLISDVMPLGDLKDAIGMLGSDSGGQRMKIVLEHG